MNSRNNSKKLAFAALMLAVAIASQFLKNLSVYITGPIVNVTLIMTVLYSGLGMATILSVILPLTSFIITGSPLMAMVPTIIPVVMLGNFIIVLAIFLCYSKCKTQSNSKLALSLAIGSIAKAAIMGALIVFLVLPIFGGALKPQQIEVARMTFSITQLITAAIGSALSLVIWPILKKVAR